MADKYRCPVCLKDVALTATDRFRKHTKGDGGLCDMSAVLVPAHVLASGPADASDVPVLGRDYAECPACGRTPRITPEGAYAPHRIIPSGSEQCPMSGEAFSSAGGVEAEKCDTSPSAVPTPDSTTTNAPLTSVVAPAPLTSAPTNEPRSSVPSQGTGTVPADAPAIAPAPVSTEPTWTSADFKQPGPPFEQPGRTARVLAQATPMNERGIEIAARLKETFFAYSNRLARSQQTTLGPSEIGTPCDRRIAMSLLRIAPVSPGGDGWAAFVGTCVHRGFAEMFMWANADTGRYAVEIPLEFPSAHVPKGTGDLLDRTALLFLDHKCMGRWSLDRLSTKGPTPVYRTQVHTYAYGARLKGERVDYVAIVGWPRESSSLDDLYVWTEPYDASIAIKALERVESISEAVKRYEGEPLQVARKFLTADDCRFCPFHAPGDQAGERGCNGKT